MSDLVATHISEIAEIRLLDGTLCPACNAPVRPTDFRVVDSDLGEGRAVRRVCPHCHVLTQSITLEKAISEWNVDEI
jgi:hypothetical protein